MVRVNILKQVKEGERWKLVAIPRKKSGAYDWESLPEGRYFVEWYERGKRKREAGGGTAAEAQEVARRRKHTLEGRGVGADQRRRRRDEAHGSARRRETLPRLRGGAQEAEHAAEI